MSLTVGKLQGLIDGDNLSQPVVQVISCDAKGEGKWKVEVSDSVTSCLGILKAAEGPEVLSLMKLNKASVQALNGVKMLIIMNMEIVGKLDESVANAGEAAKPSMAAPTPMPVSTPASKGSAGLSGSPVYATSPYNQEGASPVSVSAGSPSLVDDNGIALKRAPEGAVSFAALNPYKSNFTVAARVTTKSDIKHWSNQKGEGKLFSIDLLDSEGGEIRATFFNEMVTKYYDVIQPMRMYSFQNGSVKQASKYSAINANTRYELSFSPNTIINQIADSGDVKSVSYNFVSIADLSAYEVQSNVDILAVVKHATEVSEIQSKQKPGTFLKKRELTCVDASGVDVRVTLWGEKATVDTNWSEQPIVAITKCRIGEYNNGKTLSTSIASSFIINPLDVKKAFELHEWRVAQMEKHGSLVSSSISGVGSTGGDRSAEPLASRQPMSHLKVLQGQLSLPEKGEYNTFTATVTRINDTNICYEACPECNRKVQQSMHGDWTCERCQRSFDQCVRRYILSLQLADDTGGGWMSTFNDQGVNLLGMTADELWAKGAEDEDAVKKILAANTWKQFVIKTRSKLESVKEEMKVKTTILNFYPIDYISESMQMLDLIAKYD